MKFRYFRMGVDEVHAEAKVGLQWTVLVRSQCASHGDSRGSLPSRCNAVILHGSFEEG